MTAIIKGYPEEIESESEHLEVPKEETAVEDRCGDRYLAVGRRRQPKKRTQGHDGSWKKLAAACRRMTLHAIPAPLKGRGSKGPTVEKRRRKAPECNIGIRDRGLKQQLRLGNNKTLNERNID
jgi:hypothetical protein